MNKKQKMSIFYILFFLAAIFLSVFVMLELRSDYLAVLGAAVVLLITAYLLLDKLSEDLYFYLDEMRLSKGDGSEQTDKLVKHLEEIEKIEKAIYTAKKKSDAISSEQQEEMRIYLVKIEDALLNLTQLITESTSNESGEKLLQVQRKLLEQENAAMQDQKNAVKAIIKFNKENAKQIAENAQNNSNNIIDENKNNTEQLLMKLAELAEQISHITITIPEPVVRIENLMVPEPFERIVEQAASEPVERIEKQVISAPVQAEEESIFLTDEDLNFAEIQNEFPMPTEEIPLPVIEGIPLPITEEVVIPGIEELPLPIKEEAPISLMEEIPLPVVEEIIVPGIDEIPLPVLDETIIPGLDEIPLPVMEEMKPPVVEATLPPVIEVTPPSAPVEPAPSIDPLKSLISDDPNKKLSADEIAALFAAMAR